ncbi:iron-containing redox enzyme family protein [Streptomyces sp. BR123]|uniref:iron-containing redox enzyme family protein n=1 Tax=Streptomyces sp. BR123 TaxID=2749828 RepID=UPI0015C417B2|nr:iron-containing redox enzyme family protein [Streptomyces sp. BR123]NXY98408.1 iron-containing redox enzyme family protein [Streptomyces sp. BR123]
MNPATTDRPFWDAHPRGPLSENLSKALLTGTVPTSGPLSDPAHTDPWGEDLQLTLYLLYELHYRGLPGVSDDLEWHPDLLRARAGLEDAFLTALEAEVPRGRTVAEAFAPLLEEPVDLSGSISSHLAHSADLHLVREYAVLRSFYQLKESDPHAWALPRLTGRAKAALAAIEYDEFGAGHPDAIHSHLFANLMTDLGLDPRYGHYLDRAPAAALTTVNLMSFFGLHRAWRGALVGHFACAETASSPGARRMVKALQACGAGPAAIHFYTEHVTADAVHEQIARRELIGGLLTDEPHLEQQVAFGCDATVLVENRLADHVLAAWKHGRSALRHPLDRPTTGVPRHGWQAGGRPVPGAGGER